MQKKKLAPWSEFVDVDIAFEPASNGKPARASVRERIGNYDLGNANGLLRTALRIRPLRMHCVQTRMVFTSPLGIEALITCRLGKNRRRVMPVIFVPTPPKYLALPRVSTMLPTEGVLPQLSQALDMTDSSNAKENKEYLDSYEAVGVANYSPAPSRINVKTPGVRFQSRSGSD
jgi:hypothetical protein